MTRIMFFGKLRDSFGAAEIETVLPSHVRDHMSLAEFVAGSDEALRASLNAPTVRLAADRTILAPGEAFGSPAEIAFLPPFSGG